MKKILVTLAMALTVLSGSAVNSIENIPFNDTYVDVMMYLIDLDYYVDDVEYRDLNYNIHYIATNKKDKSVVHVVGSCDTFSRIKMLWIEWKSEAQVPKNLKPIQDVELYDGIVTYTVGRWKNYFIYNSEVGNFLDK